MGDVTDVDEVETGKQRTGFYFSFLTMAIKVGAALPVGILYPMLAYFGYQPGAENDPDAINVLKYAFIAGPFIIPILIASLMWNLPIDENTRRELRRKVDAKALAAAPVHQGDAQMGPQHL